jgi:hypothetical protein
MVTHHQTKNNVTVIDDLEKVIYFKVAITVFNWKKWEKSQIALDGPQTKFQQVMYLPNMKNSANNYGAPVSNSAHSSSEDEVL